MGWEAGKSTIIKKYNFVGITYLSFIYYPYFIVGSETNEKI